MQAFSNSDKESAGTTLMTPSVVTSKFKYKQWPLRLLLQNKGQRLHLKESSCLFSAESENSEDCGHGSRVCSAPGGGTTSMLPFVSLLIQPKLCFDTLTMKRCMKMQ